MKNLDKKPRIVFHQELTDLKKEVSNMCDVVLDAVHLSVMALVTQNPLMAKETLRYDHEIDFLELGIDGDKLSTVVEKSDCVVVLTGHSKFQRLNLSKIRFLAKKSPAIVDIGLIIDPVKAEKSGFVYRGLGRGVWTK